MTPRADVVRGVVLDGRYRIEDVIGQGGMATVYRAHDEVLGRDVAVKLFPPSPDGDEVLRHRSEMRVLARLSHPNLVMLHDAGSAFAGGALEQTYLVMELVPGPTLADLLATGPLSPRQAARVGRQLAEALAAVHEAGVVHRDIKPANVLLVEREKAQADHVPDALTTGPVVKIADFGIARFADGARLTMTGTTLGTATYLSPEQASGETVGPPTDVYALGLVLLECLTGRKAFTGTVVEVAAARLNADPVIPTALGPRWCEVLVAMTCRDPAQRIGMAEVAARLAELGDEAAADRPAQVDADLPTAPSSVSTAATRLPPPAPDGGDDEEEHTGPTRRLRTAAILAAARERARDALERARLADDAEEAPIALAADTEPPTPPRRLPSRLTLVLAVATAVLVVAVGALLTQPGQSEPEAPTYPSVEGSLGEALEDLAESVQP